MGFLQRPAITRSSTPSPSRSATNCAGPANSEQLSPNSLCTYSSVTAGTGDLACAGGGGGCFLDWAARVPEPAPTARKLIAARTGKKRRQNTRENDMFLL